MNTLQAYIRVGDVPVTVADIAQAIAWLDANMGTEFTFTQGMHGHANPLAGWSAKQAYKGLKKNPGSSTVPPKEKIRNYLRGVLVGAEADQALEAAAWITAETAGGQGFSVDPGAKIAIEMRAMEAARRHYAKLGWLEADAQAYLHNPFDLILTRNGLVKHVEVKGTTQKAAASPGAEVRIFLTRNEVAHARHCQASLKCDTAALFILAGVRVVISADGVPVGEGGSPLVRDPWRLAEEALEPMAYSYRVTDS